MQTETRDRAAETQSSFTPIHWLMVLTAVLLTRFSWAPSYLWTDNVNLAYALQSFDPRQHQPQPPGYPLFVAVARLIRFFSPSNGVAFWIVSVGVTIASALILYSLAKRMASHWVGVGAVILFFLNPVLWFSRLRSPLRPWLAFFSLLVAYCAWRCWNGERRFVFWGAIALGVGIGFRPDVLAYLLPLWVAGAWTATRSWKALAQGGLLIVALSALWFAIVIAAMGGITSTIHVIAAYLQEQSRQDSILFATSIRTWLRPISRLVVWNATAFAGWIWASVLAYRHLSFKDRRWSFMSIWVVPGLVVQLLIHIASPGHTLFATPVWCLMGAYVIFATGRYRDTILAIAAAVSASLFLNLIPLGYPAPPEASPIEKTFISIRNSIAFGTFETSQDRLRWWEEMAEVSMQELSKFSASNRPNVIVALNGNEEEFDFVNWRVVSYYADRPLVVLMDNLRPGQAGRIRSVRGNDVKVTGQSAITLPRSGRVLWILRGGGRFHRALERYIPVNQGRYIVYSDIPPDARPFTIEGFEFIPK